MNRRRSGGFYECGFECVDLLDQNGVQTQDNDEQDDERRAAEENAAHDSHDRSAHNGDDIVHRDTHDGVAQAAARVNAVVVDDEHLAQAADHAGEGPGDDVRDMGQDTQTFQGVYHGLSCRGDRDPSHE